MSSRPRPLELLVRRDPGSAASILAAAIPHAEPDELYDLCRAAVATGRPEGLAAVLAALNRLQAPNIELLDASDASMDEAIGLALVDADAQVRQNIIDAIGTRAKASLAHHLVSLLDADDGEVPSRAAAVLAALTAAMIGETGRRTLDSAGRSRIDEAVAAAADRYRRHRQGAVLTALALAAARPGPAVRAILEQEDHAAVVAMRGIGERVDDPVIGRNLIRWLGNPYLRRTATRWVHKLGRTEPISDALIDGHLMLAPDRRRPLREAERAMQCLPGPGTAATLSPEAQRWLPLLVQRLGLSRRTRVGHLADIIALPSPIARWKTVTALLTERSTDAAESIRRFRHDRVLAVARAASQPTFSSAGPSNIHAWQDLHHSGHRALANRAQALLARSRVESLFEHRSQLDDLTLRAAALRQLAENRAQFLEHLRLGLRRGTVDDQFHLLMLARRLRLASELEEELLSLAESASPRVASAAMSGLGGGRTRRRLEVLLAGLSAADSRVSANAVEALDRIGQRKLIRMLTPLLGSKRNRPRANAVKAMLRTDTERGLEELRRMLRDNRPLHRVSAIWAARSARCSPVATELRQLARTDALPEIRTRAETALRFLDASDSRQKPSPIGTSACP